MRLKKVQKNEKTFLLIFNFGARPLRSLMRSSTEGIENKMYRLFFTLLLLVIPVSVQAEVIQKFETWIHINNDGTFQVTETIDYDFADQSRHGIYRHIPTDHPQSASKWYKKRLIDIENISVLADAEKVPYELDQNGEVALKIGDPDKTLTGQHQYTISYQVSGGLSYLSDGTVELYWNVIGNDWQVPIKEASVFITAEPGVLVEQSYCYVGIQGSKDVCETIDYSPDKISFISGYLNASESFTVAQKLNSEKVATLIVENNQTWWIWLALIIVWLVILGVFVYRYRTAYKPDMPVIAQYEPYADFKPMFSGVLLDGHLHPQDITAGLVYLAEKGFISITKTSRKVLMLFETSDYEVTLKRAPEEVETNFLKQVLELLFDQDNTIGTKVSLSKLKTDSSKQRSNYKALQKLQSAIKDDLIERGFFEKLVNLPIFILVVVGLVALLVLVSATVNTISPVMIFALVALVVSSILALAFMYRRRTRKGYEAMYHLKGFKEFLSVTDKERFKFHNAPAKSPQQFMEFLPYAIAFGVEKEWAEVFKDIALPNPDWYQGNTGTTFSAVALTNDLSAFSSSFAESSGSSTSASGGGGYSGGGAGGGGGGSW